MLVDQSRLWSDLMTLGAIGALPRGGNDRMALTDADRDGRSLFRLWCEQEGLAVATDAMGNMFARREGTDPSLPPILAGSHLDTQSPGGKFDGPLGVLGALAAVRALNAAGRSTRRSIEVVNWTNEEGARFSPGLMGSAVFADVLPVADAYASVDRGGRFFGDELGRIRNKGAVPVGGRAVDAYFELHIEQGPLLEEMGITIGAVTHSHYSLMADITCLGENSHIQSMPMLARRNALVGAARVIAEIDRIGRAFAPAGSASAVTMDLWPNNRINIPHRAVFGYGLIHPDHEGLESMAAAIEAATQAIAAETGLTFETTFQRRRDPVFFTEELIALTETIAADLSLSVTRMRTRPGHDAFNMLKICPTALIFVPCRGGISHNELEFCEPEHCAAGANTLLHAIVRRADR
jgi:N-carbamoyl-L-amino-acid hydrolase